MIEVSNIKKVFKLGQQKVEALKGINLKVEKEDFVSIMGPSGSGKTTLMNIIGCLDTPTSGNYYLNNQLVSELDDDALAKIRNQEIGFVFQSFHLLAKNSALDNVLLPTKYAGTNIDEATKRAKHVLDQVGLTDRINHGPSELSGGQQQRVAIARALVNQPSILFADEPTGNLDPQTSNEIMEVFKRLHKQGMAVFMATHDYNMIVKFPGKIFKCDSGKVFEVIAKQNENNKK